MPRKIIYATLIALLMTEAVYAQMSKPGVTLKNDKPSRTKELKEYDKALDQTYQSTLKDIPDQKRKWTRGAISVLLLQRRPRISNNECLAARRFPPPWSAEELDDCRNFRRPTPRHCAKQSV
jgi:hypothetical protein